MTQRLSQALQVALRDPKVVARFAELGTAPVAQDRRDAGGARAFWQADIAKWKPIIEAAASTPTEAYGGRRSALAGARQQAARPFHHRLVDHPPSKVTAPTPRARLSLEGGDHAAARSTSSGCRHLPR